MTLTKKMLLEKFKPKVTEFSGEATGTFYVKPPTELQRCKRVGELYDKNGNPIPAQNARRRAYQIVDQLCDADGNLLFSEADVNDILALDSVALDVLLEAINEVNGVDEKKETAE